MKVNAVQTLSFTHLLGAFQRRISETTFQFVLTLPNIKYKIDLK